MQIKGPEKGKNNDVFYTLSSPSNDLIGLIQAMADLIMSGRPFSQVDVQLLYRGNEFSLHLRMKP